jgi:hypothetical protein
MFVFGLRLAYTTYKIHSFRRMLRFLFDQVLKKWLLIIFITLFIYSVFDSFADQPLFKIWEINNSKDCTASIWKIWFLFSNMPSNCQICLPWMSIFTSEIVFTILAIPFLLIFKTSKKIGYGLFILLIINSMIISSAILSNR